MTGAAPKKLTASEFLDWALDQHEGKRYELVAGEPVAMAPECDMGVDMGVKSSNI